MCSYTESWCLQTMFSISPTLSGINLTDPGEGGDVVVIVPDATTDELETFVRKLFCPGDDVYYKAVQNTPIPVPGTPEVYHTAVPQTPLLPHRESVDSSEFNKRDIRHRLD